MRLEGVEIYVPPGRKADLEALRQAGRQAAGTAPARTDVETAAVPEPPFVIERLVSSSARLVVMPATPTATRRSGTSATC